MTKKQIFIYSIIFVVLISGLFISIFGLIKKNNLNKINGELVDSTSTPILIIDITWPEAVNLIQNCQIKTIFQKRNLEVTLTDKNKDIFKTKEPKFNDVFIETNHLRSDCNDIIQTITE